MTKCTWDGDCDAGFVNQQGRVDWGTRGLHHGLGHVAYPTFCPHPIENRVRDFWDAPVRLIEGYAAYSVDSYQCRVNVLQNLTTGKP